MLLTQKLCKKSTALLSHLLRKPFFRAEELSGEACPSFAAPAGAQPAFPGMRDKLRLMHWLRFALISVRQAEAFRFRLTTDTLAFG